MSALREERLHPAWVRAGLALGVGLGVLAVRELGWLAPAELGLYDRYLRAEPAGEGPAPPVVIVRIREQEIARLGHPVPDAAMARALERLRAAGPRAIGVDNYRPGPSRAGPQGEAGWAALERVVRSDPRIVLIEKLPGRAEPGVPGPPFAEPGSQLGFNDLVRDFDDAVRRAYLLDWDADGRARLSFSLLLALHYLQPEGVAMGPAPEDPQWIRIGETSLPPFDGRDGGYLGEDAGGYSVLLDFAACRRFASVGLSEVLDAPEPLPELRDRVVILGTTAPSVKDDYIAPCRSGLAAEEEGVGLYGVELHAHAVDQLVRAGLEGVGLRRSLPEPLEGLWILAWSLAGAGVAVFTGSVLSGVAAALAGVAAVAGLTWGAFVAGLWLPVMPPALAWVGSGGVSLAFRVQRERQQRRALMELFGLHVGHPVAAELWRRRDEYLDAGRPRSQRLTITALLSDLKGYTEASEKMDPVALMDWINEYMAAMTRVIQRHGGHVDDYVGDGIKVNFGVPFAADGGAAVAADARRAVDCALDMGRTLEELNARWRERGLPTGRMRVGIFTGPAVVGLVGDSEEQGRMKYTTVGDTVNTAARLEGLSVPGQDFDRETALFRILVGESTARHLARDGRYAIEPVGEHRVKGKGSPLAIHRVLGRRDGEGGSA